MRTHRTFAGLQPWSWRHRYLTELVCAERLVVARFEPATRGRAPSVVVDLHFSDGERAVTIPLIFVDLAQLDVRELDPLVFPQAVLGHVSDPRARDVLERVLPDLERRGVGGGFWSEEVVRFAAAPIFDAARERGFFGAVPLAQSLPRVAAAVYGQRFANRKHAYTYGADAFEAAAFLGAVATSCVTGESDAAAQAYFGEFAAATPGGTFDLTLGSGPPPVATVAAIRTDADAPGLRLGIATPLPADLMVAFGAEYATAPGAFSVTTEREPFARTVPDVRLMRTVGGSAGRIAIVLRPDATVAPDSDSAEAGALAGVLRDEGFTVDVLTETDALDAAKPDLVHLFGVRPGGFARAVAEWAAGRRKPLVVHAFYDAPLLGGYWGAMAAPYCFGYSGDDHAIAIYLEMLARRAVEVDGATALAPFAPPLAGHADSERVLALADLVLVNSERERAAVEALRPQRLTLVVPSVPTLPAPGRSVGALVGDDPFVLVHASIGPESNQLMLARAVADVGVPAVFAGNVADPAYAERLREFAPLHASVIAEPAPQALASLYASAAVVADASWTGRGHGNLLTGAAFGAALVTSLARWIELPESGRWSVDPADASSIARGIGEAWDAAIRSDPSIQATARFARERLATAGAAILGAYARIG